MRLLLVEDETDLGIAIKRTLNQYNYIVDWVQDGMEAWQFLNTSEVTYVLGIFDWLLPSLSGIDLLRRLRQVNHTLPVLVLTAKDREEDKVMGLDAGADDYLVKPFGMNELLARLRALQRRSPQFLPQQLKRGNLTLDYASYSISCFDQQGKSQVIILTHKEFQLLEYFLNHPNQILTRDQILAQLWEWEDEPISNVVAAQIRLLRRKLKVFNGENWIETIYGLGYRFVINYE
jgi:DNA-binding response OmpR family regulator